MNVKGEAQDVSWCLRTDLIVMDDKEGLHSINHHYAIVIISLHDGLMGTLMSQFQSFLERESSS